MKIINEMAQSRSWIINKCNELGTQFTKHFDKIYNETDNNTKLHHAQEMQNWFDAVKDLKFKHNKKTINAKQLWDWFFLGLNYTSASELFPNDLSEENLESAKYVDFSDLILDEDYSVREALEELGMIEKMI